MSLVGCEVFSSAEYLNTECGSGNGAHTEIHAPAWPHSTTTSLLMMVSASGCGPEEAGTTWKGQHKKVQNISFMLLGSLSPVGVAGEKPPLAAKHKGSILSSSSSTSQEIDCFLIR